MKISRLKILQNTIINPLLYQRLPVALHSGNQKSLNKVDLLLRDLSLRDLQQWKRPNEKNEVREKQRYELRIEKYRVPHIGFPVEYILNPPNPNDTIIKVSSCTEKLLTHSTSTF